MQGVDGIRFFPLQLSRNLFTESRWWYDDTDLFVKRFCCFLPLSFISKRVLMSPLFQGWRKVVCQFGYIYVLACSPLFVTEPFQWRMGYKMSCTAVRGSDFQS